MAGDEEVARKRSSGVVDVELTTCVDVCYPGLCSEEAPSESKIMELLRLVSHVRAMLTMSTAILLFRTSKAMQALLARILVISVCVCVCECVNV